ncbi:MAG: hypothetical protein ACREDT_08710 [Methylocella sp.]
MDFKAVSFLQGSRPASAMRNRRLGPILRAVACLVMLGWLFASCGSQAAHASSTGVLPLGGGEGSASAAAPQTTVIIKVVFPGVEKFLIGWVEYNTFTCAEISSGAWTYTTPAHGTVSVGTVTGTASSGPCAGMTYTFGAIYYTLNESVSGVKTDTFSGTWQTPDGTTEENTFDLIIPSVTIVSEDITKDSIIVDPEPSGKSGTLVITAIGDKATPVVVNQTVSGGAQVELKYGETVTPLPASHYSKLKAVWTVKGFEFKAKLAVNFTALGLYQNTVYNIPAESMCSGAPSPVTLWTTVPRCTSTPGMYKSDFISQTNLNGTGKPLIGGHTHHEGFCASGNTDFRHPFTIMLACGGGRSDLGDNTIAAFHAASTKNPGILVCGDDVFFVGENPSGDLIGMHKTVTDNCPACKSSAAGTTGHVDNFITSHACSGTSLPNFQAILIGK